MTKRIISCLVALLLLLAPLGSSFAAGAATLEEAVSAFLADEMAAKAETATDAWQQYVYGQGVSEIAMDLEKFDVTKNKPLSVSFLLCSGAPDWKGIGPYEGDPEAFLAAVAASAGRPDTKGKLSLTLSLENGTYSAAYAKGAQSALEKAVKQTAAKGKKAMGNKTMLSAVTDYLTPSPVAVGKKAPESLQEITPAFSQYLVRNPRIASAGLAAASFYTMKGQKLDVSGGPGAIQLHFTMANISDLRDEVYPGLYQKYCYDEKAKKYNDRELGEHVEEALEQRAIRYRHSKQADIKCTVSMDLFDLPKDMSYLKYLTGFKAIGMPMIKSGTIADLRAAIQELPDYPAQEFPESGLVQGSNRGTKVVVKNRNTALALSLTFTKKNGGDVAAVVFIRPKDKATFRIPQGTYSLETQVGVVWYGPEHRFGDYTGSNVEEGVRILNNNKYYHIFTYEE